jgi:Tfp pilus assembly protein PilF
MFDEGAGTADHAKASAAYAEATRLKPDLLQAWNNLGLALERAGRPAEAIGALRHALALDAGYPPALRNLAALALRQEEFVTRARAFGQDPARRRAISTRMQGAREELLDRPEPAAALADWLERHLGPSASVGARVPQVVAPSAVSVAPRGRQRRLRPRPPCRGWAPPRAPRP